jgi:hypothetical protein
MNPVDSLQGSERVISPLQDLSLHRTTQTEKKTQTSIPQTGFEPTIPVFELTKIFRAFDSVATDRQDFLYN